MRSQNSSASRRKRTTRNKTPVTEESRERSSTSSSDIKKHKTKQDSKIVSKLHEFVKDIDQVESDGRLAQGEKKVKIQTIQAKIDELGGLQAYQAASQSGKSHHGNVSTAKWIIAKLKEFGIRANKDSKLRLLDVGALEHNYIKHTKWIDTVAIDLNPQVAGIVKADFLTFQDDHPEMYDIIVMSLVLNFPGSSTVRGDMLKKCKQICKPDGHLFVVLPLACLENSRYLTHDVFHDMMNGLGFTLISTHNSRKLSYKMFKNVDEGKKGVEKMRKTLKRKKVHSGVSCNNFSIIIS